MAAHGLHRRDALSERQWCNQVELRADDRENTGVWTADRPGGDPDGGAVGRAAVTRLACGPDVLAELDTANAVRVQIDAVGDAPDAPHAPDASNALDAAFAADVEPYPKFVGGVDAAEACRSPLIGRSRTVSRVAVGHACAVPCTVPQDAIAGPVASPNGTLWCARRWPWGPKAANAAVDSK